MSERASSSYSSDVYSEVDKLEFIMNVNIASKK